MAIMQTLPVDVTIERNSSLSEKASKNDKRHRESNCNIVEVKKGNQSLEGLGVSRT